MVVMSLNYIISMYIKKTPYPSNLEEYCSFVFFIRLFPSHTLQKLSLKASHSHSRMIAVDLAVGAVRVGRWPIVGFWHRLLVVVSGAIAVDYGCGW